MVREQAFGGKGGSDQGHMGKGMSVVMGNGGKGQIRSVNKFGMFGLNVGSGSGVFGLSAGMGSGRADVGHSGMLGARIDRHKHRRRTLL